MILARQLALGQDAVVDHRVHVLPDRLAGRGDLEERAFHARANQRIAVGQPMGAGDLRRIEVLRVFRLVSPTGWAGP